MSVATETVVLKKLAPVNGVQIAVAIPVFAEAEVVVTYGRAAIELVQVTDYLVTLLTPDAFDTFTITPTASMITKIAALIAADVTEENAIWVRRRLDYLSDSSPAYSSYSQYVSLQHDRSVARDQQLQEQIDRTVKAPVGGTGTTFPRPSSDAFIGWNTGATALENKSMATINPVQILDEDNMVSNSDTKVPTQQSVKAYVDAGDAGALKPTIIVDEDDMVSDSAVKLPTQQSVKAYTDRAAFGRDVRNFGASVLALAAVNAPAFLATINAALAEDKFVCVDAGTYGITGLDRDKLHSVTFVGYGNVSGVYRKQVFNPLTPGPSDSYVSDVIPANHLRKLNAAYERTGTINVVFWGDSLGTFKPGPGSARMDLKIEAYRAMLIKQFPNATVNLYDRSIGGLRYQDWDLVDAAAAATYTWYVGGTAWNTHIGALSPDLVILGFGMNYSASIQELVDIRTYLGTLNCDVLWETNLIPNLAYAGFNQASYETLDREAGMTRSYARYIGDGLIDFHRRCCIVRDGFDVRQAHSLEGTKETIAAVANQCVATQYGWNWKVTSVFDASAWANGATTQLQVVTGNTDDYLAISKSAGGFWQFQWVCTGASALSGPLVVSAAAASTSATAQVTVEVRDDVVTVYFKEGQTAVVSEGPTYTSKIVRKTSYARPYVQLALPGSASLTSASFVHTEQRKNMPLITNKELWDSSYYTADGGINHPTSAGGEMIYLPVLHDIQLRAPSGQIFYQAPQAVTPNTTVETTLASKALAAGYVAAGKRGKITAAFNIGADANTKTIRVKLAGTTVYTYAGAQNGGSMRLDLDFVVAADGFTYVSGYMTTTAGLVQIDTAFANAGWASANTFFITGQNTTGGVANEIAMRFCLFDLLPRTT